jgi:hypothetical protein
MTQGDRDDQKSAEEKRDRQMIELLNELRVAMPGVQILFGFLLTVPFSQGFSRATDFQKYVFYVTLLLVALSTACLIAPSTAHRVLFHQQQRPWLIEHANRMLIGGAAFLALALVGAVLLVTDYLFESATVWLVPLVLGLILVGLWFLWPARRRRSTQA